MSSSKTCKRCGQDRPISEYYVYLPNKDGRRGVCSHCMRERERKRSLIHRMAIGRDGSVGLLGEDDAEREIIRENYEMIRAEKDSIEPRMRAQRTGIVPRRVALPAEVQSSYFARESGRHIEER